MSHEIPLSKPDITQLEIDAVTRVLTSGRLSIGPVLEEFERAVATQSGNLFGIGCNSGTSGLHLAMMALNIKPGDEVITTPFSFIASANPILMVGARPQFVDICPRTLNMDPDKLAKAVTPKTRAIIAVETFGNPEYMDQYAQIAARMEIPVIEDCCEALGCSYRGKPAGSFGRIGVFGFYPNKQITTGEGGMIVTNDKRLADLCRSLRSQGRAMGVSATMGTGSWLHHERLGYNFRLSEINAALGVVQMKRLGEIVLKRQRLAEMYMRRLMRTGGDIILPTINAETVMSWFVFVIRLGPSYTREDRDRIIAGIRRHDVGAGDYFPCIHTQPFYQDLGYRPGDYPIAESVSARTIALPFFNDMTERDVEIVCQTLELMLKRENLSRA